MDDKNVKKKGKDHTTDEENTSNGKPVEIKEPVEQGEIDYKDKYLRALADYQNLLKRVEKEKQDFVQYANERLILNLLEIIDDFERAKATVKDTGIELIYKKLVDLISSEGFERIVISEHDSFNPDYMHCIEAEPDGKRIVEVRPGYRKNGKIVRAAQVNVVK